MNRSLFPASLLLGAVLFQHRVIAQPAVPDTKGKNPTFSVAELERFVGGRTLVTLDVKDATLEEVAAALSQAIDQKVEVRDQLRNMAVNRPDGTALDKPKPPFYSFSSAQTPFWEALRNWQLAAQRENEAARALNPNASYSPGGASNSVGLTKKDSGWWLQPDTSMARGRAVATWPFLVLASGFKRTQEAQFSEQGLREIETAPPRPRLTTGKTATATDKAATLVPVAPRPPAPEEKRWLDRLVLNGQTFVDPKVLVTALRCEVQEAVDDKGNDLRLSEADERAGFGTSFGNSYSFGGGGTFLQIDLRSQPEMGKRLVRLRGMLRFNVVTRSQHWETTQLQTATEGTVFQDGGEFKVQFQGIEKSGDAWNAKFTAQSRGAHLVRFWEERVASRWSSNRGRSSSGVLDFEGVPQMRLLDENGRVFQMNDGSGMMRLTGGTATAPVVTSPDLSPVPPDAAQNWTFSQERNLTFRPAYNPATGSEGKMGRPVKLILDLPLERREVEIPFEFTNLPLPPS